MKDVALTDANFRMSGGSTGTKTGDAWRTALVYYFEDLTDTDLVVQQYNNNQRMPIEFCFFSSEGTTYCEYITRPYLRSAKKVMF